MMDKRGMADPMVGYAFVPFQIANIENIYSAEKGHERGTLFPELDKPLGIYGNESKQTEALI